MSTSNLGTNPPTGMRDFLPEAAALRDYATAIILKTYLEYGFSRIETSVLEDVRRLTGGDGGENEGLIFKILKRARN
jgi:histidyl-tRNA synthetase